MSLEPGSGGQNAASITGGAAATPDVGIGAGEIRRSGAKGMSRSKSKRETRRAAQFAKFKMTELNLVPLVDTFVSIVFFALTTATVGELTPVVPGVTLPSSAIGNPALQEITLGIGRDVSLSGARLMSTSEAAAARSDQPNEPLVIPALYARLRQKADSIRGEENVAANASVPTTLAIQGDKTMRYDLLARVMQTARRAGFRNISLQVSREEGDATTGGAAPAGQSS